MVVLACFIDTVETMNPVSSVLKRTALRGRRGFSLAEVAVAGTVFLIVASLVTLVVGRTMSARAATAARGAIESKLESSLDEVARSSFDDLLDNSFTVPLSCDGTTGQGTRSDSCFSFGGGQVRGYWTTDVGVDSAGASNVAADSVTVAVSVTLSDNSSVERRRIISAPNAGYNGQGVVRVRFTGPVHELDGPVYLVDRDDLTTRAAAEVSTSGVALLRVQPGGCSTTDPCRVALAATANFASSNDISLAAANVIGEGSNVVASPGQLTQLGVDLVATGAISIDVIAEGDSVGGGAAPTAAPTVAGSVCMYAVFSDGVAGREVPMCTDSAGVMELDSYRPDPFDPSVSLPIAQGTTIRLQTDRSSGTCGAPGQQGATPNGWATLQVCTSWTWGVPSLFDGPFGRVALSDAVLTATGNGPTTGTVIFTGAAARPAAGFSGQPLWSNPREAGACTSTNSCASLGTVIAEDTVCPSQQCLAVRRPRVVAPLQGVGQIPGVQRSGLTTVFTVEVQDDGGDPVTLSVSRLPTGGQLTYEAMVGGVAVTTPVTQGTTLITTPSGGGDLELTYSSVGGASLEWFTLNADNTLPNGRTEVDVALWQTSDAFTLSARSSAVAQGATSDVTFDVVGADGNPATGAVISFTASPGISASSTGVVNAQGEVVATVSAGTAAVGAYTLTATAANGRNATAGVSVTATAGALAAGVAAPAGQGATTTLLVSATDEAGAAMEGVMIALSATDASGDPARGIFGTPPTCATSAAGSCVITISVEAAVPAGTYSLVASSNGLSVTRSITVTQVLHSLDAESNVVVSQGDSATGRLVTLDGAGQPMAGVAVNVAGVAGLSVTPALVTSDAQGVADVTVAAASTLVVGNATVTATSGAVSGNMNVQVQGNAAALSAASSVTVLQGGSTVVEVTVVDANGTPVADAAVVPNVVANGLSAVPARSDSNGVARVSFYAVSEAEPSQTTGAFELTSASNTLIASSAVTVFVSAAPKSISVAGAIESGNTVLVTAFVTDGRGMPVGGATVSFSGVPSGLSITSGVTAQNGQVVLTASGGTTLPGVYNVTATATTGSSSRTVNVSLVVIDPAMVVGP